MKYGFAIVDERTVSLEEMRVSITDLSFLYGPGIYETLKLRSGILYFLDEHFERLQKSAEIIGIAIDVSDEELRNRVHTLVNINRIWDANIRIVVLADCKRGSRMYMFDEKIPELPGNADQDYPDPVGVDGALFREERQFPQAKSLSMLMSSIVLRYAAKLNCWDAILVNRDGELLEGSKSNLYWIRGKTIFSAHEEKILSGVTRKKFMTSVHDKAISMKNGSLLLDELVREPVPLFISSTSIAIQPLHFLVLENGSRLELPCDNFVLELAAYYREYLRIYSAHMRSRT